MSLSSVFTSRPVTVSLAVTTALAVVNAISGPTIVMLGLLVAGPCLAAVSARPRVVLLVGAYAIGLVLILSWWPDHIWGTWRQLVYVLAVLTVTALSTAVATRHRVLTDAAARGNEGRRLLAAIVDSSDDAIITKTLDGIITSWNPGAERMYGYRADEAIGDNISMIVGAVEAAELVDVLARIRRGERIEHYETQRFCKDGTIKDVSVTISPVRDDAGNVTGGSAVARDISDRKHAEAHRELVEKSSQQAQRLQSLGQLAGGIAHDFNNLLAIIGNYAEFVAEEIAADSPAQADIEAIRRATERATALARQLLVFARREPLQATAFDLNPVVEESQRLLARTIGEHIEVNVNLADGPLMIYADRGQIQQVLMNLALNARDAMSAGGRMVIETTAAQIDTTLVDPQLTLAPGDYARLIVSDTGGGMCPEVVAHIFEPFFTTKPKDQATGLGLATVHGIVAQAGGDIGVYSEPNLGTTMRIYLPLTDKLGERAEHLPVIPPPRGYGQMILVVEDEDAIRHLVVRILENHGFVAHGVGGAQPALALADQHSFDLLLTDVVMPGMSGPQLAGVMRKRHPEVALLFMSGYSDGLLMGRGDIGEITLVQKPFTANELLFEVDAALTRAGRVALAAEHPANAG